MKFAQQLILTSLVSVFTLAFSTSASAVDTEAAQALAKENKCFRCHGIDKDKEGPAWTKIAVKYKGKPNAEASLTHHVTAGDNVKFSDGHEEAHKKIESKDPAEIKNLVDWILSL